MRYVLMSSLVWSCLLGGVVGCTKEKPDLATSAAAAVPLNPLPGASVTITVLVTNVGDDGSAGCAWTVNRDGVPGLTGGSLSALAPGASEPLTFSVTETEASTHVYQFIANVDNAADESSFGNNSATVTVTWALPIDLQAAPLTVDPSAPSILTPITLMTLVTNAATAPGTATGVTWSVTIDGVAKSAVGVVPTLAPGASIAVPMALPIQSVGPHTFDVIIDPDGKSTDSDRSNNTQSISVIVAPVSG